MWNTYNRNGKVMQATSARQDHENEEVESSMHPATTITTETQMAWKALTTDLPTAAALVAPNLSWSLNNPNDDTGTDDDSENTHHRGLGDDDEDDDTATTASASFTSPKRRRLKDQAEEMCRPLVPLGAAAAATSCRENDNVDEFDDGYSSSKDEDCLDGMSSSSVRSLPIVFHDELQNNSCNTTTGVKDPSEPRHQADAHGTAATSAAAAPDCTLYNLLPPPVPPAAAAAAMVSPPFWGWPYTPPPALPLGYPGGTAAPPLPANWWLLYPAGGASAMVPPAPTTKPFLNLPTPPFTTAQVSTAPSCPSTGSQKTYSSVRSNREPNSRRKPPTEDGTTTIACIVDEERQRPQQEQEDNVDKCSLCRQRQPPLIIAYSDADSGREEQTRCGSSISSNTEEGTQFSRGFTVEGTTPITRGQLSNSGAVSDREVSRCVHSAVAQRPLDIPMESSVLPPTTNLRDLTRSTPTTPEDNATEGNIGPSVRYRYIYVPVVDGRSNVVRVVGRKTTTLRERLRRFYRLQQQRQVAPDLPTSSSPHVIDLTVSCESDDKDVAPGALYKEQQVLVESGGARRRDPGRDALKLVGNKPDHDDVSLRFQTSHAVAMKPILTGPDESDTTLHCDELCLDGHESQCPSLAAQQPLSPRQVDYSPLPWASPPKDQTQQVPALAATSQEASCQPRKQGSPLHETRALEGNANDGGESTRSRFSHPGQHFEAYFQSTGQPTMQHGSQYVPIVPRPAVATTHVDHAEIGAGKERGTCQGVSNVVETNDGSLSGNHKKRIFRHRVLPLASARRTEISCHVNSELSSSCEEIGEEERVPKRIRTEDHRAPSSVPNGSLDSDEASTSSQSSSPQENGAIFAGTPESSCPDSLILLKPEPFCDWEQPKKVKDSLIGLLQHHPSKLLVSAACSTKIPYARPVEADEMNPIKEADIQVTDILLGRGGLSNNHEGNIWYRKLIAKYATAYAMLHKGQKKQLAQNMVNYIRLLHGRFLVKGKGGDWFEAGDHRAEAKCSQGLREA